MKLGIRGKLFLVSVALLAAFGLIVGTLLHEQVREELEARLAADLSQLARSARTLYEAVPVDGDPSELTALTRRLGEAIEARITVVDGTGRVLGDSMLEAREIATVENHYDRPEIRQAFESGQGRDARYSSTLHQEMLYRALRYRGADGSVGVVRVALPMEVVDRSLRGLRRTFAGVGVVGLVLAAFMSGLASHLTTRTARRLVAGARALATGTGEGPLPEHGEDELGGLGGSLNRLAGDLDRSVQALARERHRFQAVLEGMSEGLVVLDEDQRITLLNPAARELLGLPAGGEGVSLLEAARIPALAEVAAEAVDRTSATREFEWGEREPRVLMARGAPLAGEGESGAVIVLHDVTELRRLEKVRRDFVANVSHELRTPVASIRASAETLATGALEDPEGARGFLEALVRNADRLGRLIADLLDLSRIESGAYRIEAERLVLAPVVERVLAGVRGGAAARELELGHADLSGLAVEADEGALEQILANLLDNAVKYTPAGGRVEVRGQRSGDGARVRIEVRDDGPGVPAHQRGRIFERFYRVDVGRSRELGGTGLGLSIVRHLAESMDGSVGLDPVTPHGSCFWVDLPAARHEISPDS